MAEQQTQQELSIPRPITPALLPPCGPRLQNIVCGQNVHCQLDYKHIANSCPEFKNVGLAEGRTGSRFPAACLRFNKPFHATALVFNSGKMQLLGNKSLDDTRLASRKFCRILTKMGFEPRPGKLEVQNMVANADTGLTIQLEGLVREHYRFARYEPEIFPGLVYRLHEPKVTFWFLPRGRL